MIRIRGDRRSLLVALAAEWAVRQLQLPPQVVNPTHAQGRRRGSR